jgi:hypothetical protein
MQNDPKFIELLSKQSKEFKKIVKKGRKDLGLEDRKVEKWNDKIRRKLGLVTDA